MWFARYCFVACHSCQYQSEPEWAGILLVLKSTSCSSTSGEFMFCQKIESCLKMSFLLQSLEEVADYWRVSRALSLLSAGQGSRALNPPCAAAAWWRIPQTPLLESVISCDPQCLCSVCQSSLNPSFSGGTCWKWFKECVVGLGTLWLCLQQSGNGSYWAMPIFFLIPKYRCLSVMLACVDLMEFVSDLGLFSVSVLIKHKGLLCTCSVLNWTQLWHWFGLFWLLKLWSSCSSIFWM